MAKKTFLDFEQPIAELESKIEELRYVQSESAVDISEEINQLSKKSLQLTKDIYSDLNPWQITKIARHPERPYTLDYVNALFTDFVEMHGDRHFADDLSIVGGLARFNGQPCMVLGHQKGRDTKEKILRNFGMPRPEGYRRAMRLMQMAAEMGAHILPPINSTKRRLMDNPRPVPPKRRVTELSPWEKEENNRSTCSRSRAPVAACAASAENSPASCASTFRYRLLAGRTRPPWLRRPASTARRWPPQTA